MTYIWVITVNKQGEKGLEIQNTLANRIDTAGEMISYDEACKQVISNKVILSWIMKACIKEYKGYNIEEIADRFIEGEPQISSEAVHVDETADFITGMNSESATIKEGTTTYDIKFRALLFETDEVVDMIINVEAQNEFYPGYPIVKRGIYYASRMISEQYGSIFAKSEYSKIKKVVSIWICPNPPEYRKNTITGYQMSEQNIIGRVQEKESNYDLLKVVVICLGGKNKEGYNGLLKLLDVLLSQDTEPSEKKKTLEDEFGIPMTTKLEGDVEAMCNLSKGVYEKGIDKAKVESILNLMDSTGWDIETCMDKLKITSEKRELYTAAVEAELQLV